MERHIDMLKLRCRRFERRGDREETEIMVITRTHSIDRRKIRSTQDANIRSYRSVIMRVITLISKNIEREVSSRREYKNESNQRVSYSIYGRMSLIVSNGIISSKEDKIVIYCW
jgi:hypothetical protein